ncbi:hypothetical protein [Legionella oakridgensis]|uniref:hypothetical protein n=1 Tax=Legionella oakridgensis TaxID=29423 RepID=UPI0003DE2125|nr:hypothetical protein [Legionella oakridgensis]ETO93739.1 hypothetical protein LOR_5c00100 [Legionella oakridgensis RV-2-2007]
MKSAKTESPTKEKNKTNYTFLLACMAALTTAAVITAGIIAATTAKSTALATTVLASKAVLAAGTTAVAASSLFLPFAVGAAALLLIGAICFLPFLFRPRVVATTSHAWSPSPAVVVTPGFSPPVRPVVVPSMTTHGHFRPVHHHHPTPVVAPHHHHHSPAFGSGALPSFARSHGHFSHGSVRDHGVSTAAAHHHSHSDSPGVTVRTR